MAATPAIESGFAAVNGTRLYYEIAGRGDPLVLLHAGVTDHHMWDDQFAVFAERYRVVRYDLRGFGRSPMPATPFAMYRDLHGLLQALGISRAYLCGVSMGGSTIVDFALAHPDMVAALIPVAAGVSGSAPSEEAQALYAALEAPYEAHDVDRVLELEMALWLAGPSRSVDAINPALQARFRAMERPNLEREFAGEEGTVEPLDPPASGRLAEIHAPTLIIAGDADVPDVLVTADKLAADIPGARKVVQPDTAHLVPMERPAEFNRLVLDFLGGL